jgi:hypothetical protein
MEANAQGGKGGRTFHTPSYSLFFNDELPNQSRTFPLGNTSQVGGIPKHLGEGGVGLDANRRAILAHIVALRKGREGGEEGRREGIRVRPVFSRSLGCTTTAGPVKFLA